MARRTWDVHQHCSFLADVFGHVAFQVADMKPKIVDLFVVFDVKTIHLPYEERPYDRAFFDSRMAIAYLDLTNTEGNMIVARFDCEVPESDTNV